MKKKTVYRTGPMGALMDVYERAVEELMIMLKGVSQVEFVKIMDSKTEDPDCRSIQTIVHHVVGSGYSYSNYIRRHFGEDLTERKTDYEIYTVENALSQLQLMLQYSSETLENRMDFNFEEVMNNRFKTNWGQEYDIEQLLEHAIVHVFRHKRQIERFLAKAS